MDVDTVSYQIIHDAVTTQTKIKEIYEVLQERRRAGQRAVVAVDLEGDLSQDGRISLLQLKVDGLPAFIFDVFDDPWGILAGTALNRMLRDHTVCKVMHDCRKDAEALYGQLGIRLQCVYDTQVAAMHHSGDRVRPGLNNILMEFADAHNTNKDNVMHGNGVWEQRPLHPQLLNYAAQDVEYLIQAYDNMCQHPKMNHDVVIALADEVRDNVLQGVPEGLPEDPVLSGYDQMSMNEQLGHTALAFFNARIKNNVTTREKCQDRQVCKMEFEAWKRSAQVPGNPPGTRFRGSFSKAQSRLFSSGKILFRNGGDKSVISWTMDCAGSGIKAENAARQSASATVRQQREKFESNRGGITVTPVQFPEVVNVGEQQRCTLTITNEGPTTRYIKEARFLQSVASGRTGVFSTDLTSVRLPLELLPESTVTVTLFCTPLFGVNRDIFELNFGTFSIGRFLEVQGGDSELYDALKPSAPYKRRKRKERARAGFVHSVGDRPRGGGRPWDRDCGDHTIPRALPEQLRLKQIDDVLKEPHTLMVLNPNGAPARLADYSEFYKLLLFVEEVQLELDLREFDMEGAVLVPDGRSQTKFRLEVPGLAENRPSVLRGDKLVVHCEGSVHQGYAHRVERDVVVLALHSSFGATYVGQPVDVEFTLNRTLQRIQHDVLKHQAEQLGLNVLFPRVGQVALRAPRLEVPSPAAKLVCPGLNPEQHAAVWHILEGRARPTPYIVFGPPGTGKTRTVVEAITQAVRLFPRTFRILACAPSNTAADVLCRGLDHLGTSELMRVVAASRTRQTVLEDIHKFCPPATDGDAEHFGMPEHEKQLKRVVVSTLSMASKLPFMLNLPLGYFDLIVIDEAGQAPEPEAVAVIANLLDPHTGQVVLAGDPRQLGPIIHSTVAKRHGLETSLLERLTNRTVYQKQGGRQGDDGGGDDGAGGSVGGTYDPTLLTKLVRNYRSHEAILTVPSKLFYDNELVPCADEILRNSMLQWERLPKPGVPLIFHGVEGKDDREANSPSWFNVSEVETVRDYVMELLTTKKNPLKPEDIGVIAPYQKQVQKIRKAFERMHVPNKDLKGIMVGSAEQFQGQEKRVIIISTTRSSKEYLNFDTKHALGFLTNPKRFNVAVTRAMSLLIVIGHPAVLVGCPNWRALLTHCRDKGACRGLAVPMVANGQESHVPTGAREDLEGAIMRMGAEPDDDNTDDEDDNNHGGASAHIQQTAIGFVREE
eukprot:m.53449 g.53449  ORF g.53449 m.53449 type:complete len:1222 (-) comp7460_c0_seq1:1994-5659(-)